MAFKARAIGTAVLCLLVSACATTAPEPDFTRPLEKDLGPYPSVSVMASARNGVAATDADLDRVSRAVVDAINKKRPAWAQAGATGPLTMNVELTRYEPGNAFARFMLAGLGQIHIDGEVVLAEAPSGAEVGRYSVSKTFAWGGIYGGTTSIDEVVPAFAESVALGVTPRRD